MLIRKAYRFKLRVNHPDTAAKLHQFSGCTRFVWNKMLAMNLYRLEHKQALLWYPEMAFWLTLWKASDEYAFLRDCHSQVLQQSMRNLDRAFKDAFDQAQPNKLMPRFKRRGGKDSFRYPQGFKVVGERVYLPKIGTLRFRKSREIEGKVKNITVSRQMDGWYVAMQTEQEVPTPVHPSSGMVGIDLGVAIFAQLSNGTAYKPLHSFRRIEQKLARAQRKLSCKVKFSNNWRKQQERITRIHQKITRFRHDYLHKISHEISKNQAVIVVEDLKVSNMSRSARGDADHPGSHVRAKSGLNKAVLDQGWSEFRRQLEYKQAWRGGLVIAVPPHYTSQQCPQCRYTTRDNRRSQAVFKCVACGYAKNADMVAASNILAAGHAVLACGEVGLPNSVKQEPLAAVA